MQYDTHSVVAAHSRHRTWPRVTGGDAPTQQAAALFKNWDGNIGADSAPAAL